MTDERMAMAAKPVHAHISGSTAILELARPDTFNCLSLSTFEAIQSALDEIEASAGAVRSILIRAQGKHFCTGADLGELKKVRRDEASLKAFLDAGHAALDRLQSIDLPVVGAVQGLCLAGGLELALSCDVIFADSQARFGDQHGKFGIIPGWGGSQRLPRIIGPRRAKDLLLSARWIDADTALQWGLVNYVCESGTLQREAQAYCSMLAGRSRKGLASMKRLADDGMQRSLADGLSLEKSYALEILRLQDVEEGIAAFEDRREPVFGA